MPAIAQDWQTGEVLMLAWMNRDALQLTIDEGEPFTGRARGRHCGARARNPDTCST